MALRFQTTTAITHFLVSPQDVKLGRLSRALTDSELARTMVVSVEGTSTNAALDAADDLARRLRDHPEVEWVRSGVAEGTQQAVFDLYQPRRFAFAADTPQRLDVLTSDEGMTEAVQGLKRELAGPLAPLVKRLAPGDPWLLFRDRMKAMESADTGGMTVVDGRFLDREGARAIVLLATVHSPFDSSHQAGLEADLQRIFEELRFGHGALTIERSAVHRFALQSEAEIRADLRRVSILSTVGIVILFLAVYRSLLLLVLALVPLAAGITTAAAVGLAIFGELHGLTLAFGATLIGICIDYPAHYFTHHVVEPDPRGAGGTLRRVWPGLAVGAVTTVAGFAGLAGASFPGIREIGVFSGVGIGAALLATRYILPGLMPDLVRTPRLAAALTRRLGALVATMEGRRRPLAVLPALAVVVSVVGLPRMQWVDDAQALNRLQPVMLEEDERVRDRVSRMDVARMVVATAPTREQALQINDQVHTRLTSRHTDGVEFRSLHAFLWSEATQRASLEAFRRVEIHTRMAGALARAGFRPEAFGELERGLTGAAPDPLTLDDLLASPLAPAVRAFTLQLEDEVAILTFVHGVDGPEQIKSALSGLDGAVYFDQRQFLARNYQRYRVRIQQLVGLGLAVVGLVLLVRYRSLRLAAAAFAPAILAAVTTLALLSLMGAELHLLHLVGVLLVLSMGVDYGVFLAESVRRGAGESATLLGLVIACVSTVLAFGLLAVSANPAMHAVGLTTGIGVLISLVLAPTTLVLTRGPRPRKGRP